MKKPDVAIANLNSGNVSVLLNNGDGTLAAAVNQAVADGRIEQERADTIKSKVPDRVDHFLNRTWGQKAAAGASA